MATCTADPAPLLLQTGPSRFEGFKLGYGQTLVVRATLCLNISGIYTIRVSAAGRQVNARVLRLVRGALTAGAATKRRMH